MFVSVIAKIQSLQLILTKLQHQSIENTRKKVSTLSL